MIPAVPPLRFLGVDSTGTAIVGLPQLRVVVECGGCGRFVESSGWRHHAARVCRRCEAMGQGSLNPVHDQMNQEATPPVSATDSLPFNTASRRPGKGPLTRARSPREPGLYQPSTAPLTRKSAKYDPGGVPERRRSRSKESNRSDRRRPTTAVIRPCSRRDTTLKTEPTRTRQSRTDRALKGSTALGSEQYHDHGDQAENQENETNEPE